MLSRPRRRFQPEFETCEVRRLLSPGVSRIMVEAPMRRDARTLVPGHHPRRPAPGHHPTAPILRPEKPIKDELPAGSITIASLPTLNQPWTPVVTYKSKYAGTTPDSVMFLFNYRDPPGSPSATTADGQLSVTLESIEHDHVVLEITGPTHTYTMPGSYTFGVSVRERDPQHPRKQDRVYEPSHGLTFTLSAPGPPASSDTPPSGGDTPPSGGSRSHSDTPQPPSVGTWSGSYSVPVTTNGPEFSPGTTQGHSLFQSGKGLSP
jgi:hypothetical protein